MQGDRIRIVALQCEKLPKYKLKITLWYGAFNWQIILVASSRVNFTSEV